MRDVVQDQAGTGPLPRLRLALIRESESPYGDAPLANHPDAAAQILWRNVFSDAPQEQMAAVFLDLRNRVIGVQVPFVGTATRAAVEPRAILAAALLCNAAAFILAHNHPSGDASPSPEDLAFTRRMAAAGELIGIRLVDHLILGDSGQWISLQRRGAW